MRWHMAVERVLGSRQGRAWVCHGVASVLPVNSFLLTRSSMGRYMRTRNSIQYMQTTKRGGLGNGRTQTVYKDGKTQVVSGDERGAIKTFLNFTLSKLVSN